MWNVLILGAGNIGSCIAKILSSKCKDINIYINDINDSLLKNIENNNLYPIYGQITSYKDYDLVISALPYHKNLAVAKQCIAEGVGYMDLGGKVENTIHIKELSHNSGNKSFVFTDCGLAPGLINIWSENLLQDKNPADVKLVELFVGGIPNIIPVQNDLNYKVTWSLDGLVNEYRDKSVILSDGKIETVLGLDGLEEVCIGYNKLEAFYTSGASAHTVLQLLKKGYKNFHYKTLRWRGHRDIVKLLLDIYEDEACKHAIVKLSKRNEKVDDMVVMAVKIEEVNNKECIHSHTIFANEQYSAMQLATAVPVCAIASMYLKDSFDKHCYTTYGDLAYKEMYTRFSNLMTFFGVKWA